PVAAGLEVGGHPVRVVGRAGLDAEHGDRAARFEERAQSGVVGRIRGQVGHLALRVGGARRRARAFRLGYAAMPGSASRTPPPHRRLLALLGAVLLAAAAPAGAAPRDPAEPTRVTTLPNGLTVLTLEDPR